MSGTSGTAARRAGIAAAGAIFAAAAADLLFWGETPGLSVSVFAVILAGVVAGARWLEGRSLAPAGGVFLLLSGAAAAAALDFGFANFCVLSVLFVVLAGETFYGDRPRLWARALSQAAASLRFPAALPKWGFELFRAGLVSPQGAAARFTRLAAVVFPALAAGLLFALLLGAGNAVFGSWFGEAWKAFCAWIGQFSFGRLCFALFTASVALTLIAPARVGPRWWGWAAPREGAGVPEAPARYLYWQAVAGLATVNALFLAANGADAVYLWAHRAIPAGVNASRYVHEGTGSLIAAVLAAGVVLSFLFRRCGGLLPQRAPRLLAYAWIGQCLFLLASVALRLQLYVQDFGLTKARVELTCFLLLVCAGFVLLAGKIACGRSFRWLVAANAVSVFALFYVLQFWDMGGFVARWNVDRWEANPEWKLDIAYLANPELGPGAWKELRRVVETPARPAASKKAYILLEKKREMVPIPPGWRSWQARGTGNRKYLETVPPRRPLGDPCWDGAVFSPEAGLTLLLERWHDDDTMLAEFQRKLAVRTPDNVETRLDLPEDTGGTVRMNVYRDGQGNFLLRDRLDCYRIDLRAETVVCLREWRLSPEIYLGCFDADGAGLAFFPVSERPEAALSETER